MGLIAISLFLGVSYLAIKTGARPSESVSLLSEIARAVFPASSASSILYFVVQGTTLAILVLAANTSYQGFPRLAAVLASDRFFPRQFVNLGDRLVYSNGIIVLAAVAALLIWVFHADVISLIHLYVIGVFTAFTLSQAGMVRHWYRSSDPGRRWRGVVNGLGAAATGLVTIVVIQTKFTQGAWMVIVAVPVLIVLFLLVNRHYHPHEVFAYTISAGQVTNLPAKVTGVQLKRGDHLVLRPCGGGGFGDPKSRDAAAIRRDLELGFVTPEGARKGYCFDK